MAPIAASATWGEYASARTPVEILPDIPPMAVPPTYTPIADPRPSG
jgi:hypothetical protein